MASTAVMDLPPELRQRAWKALVRELGIVDATRFVMAVEPGTGDGTERYAKLWEGMSLDQIHQEVLDAKKRGEIA